MRTGWVAIGLSVVVGALMLGCQSTEKKEGVMSGKSAVTGTAAYRERIALPPDAVLTVRLEDVSKADAQATLLGEQIIKLDGRQVPVAFEIPYDPAAIRESDRINVRASVSVDGQLWFASAQAHPVLTHGHPARVEVLMQRVSEKASAASANAPLLDTYWKLTAIKGTPVTLGSDPIEAREPHIILLGKDERFAGSGGVNRFMGSFKTEGSSLKLMPGPSTLMAGPDDLMKQESAFFAATATVTAYKITGDTLTMLAGDEPVLIFKAGKAKE